MSFALRYGDNGIWYGQFSHFPADLFTQAISTRFGGVSGGAYRSLNLALHNGDAGAEVLQNRRLFAAALSLPLPRFVTAEQVHGAAVLQVDESYAGRGGETYADAILATDALITNCRNLPLMLFFADCVPVLIADPVQKAIGISHAGWKGTVHKIAQRTVLAMQKKFNTRSEDCIVGIGPSIGACCYEVGTEVAEQFSAAFPAQRTQILRSFGEKWKLDLWAANRVQLEEIGVLPQHIEIAGTCSACNADVFFSYRADQGKTGRIAATICLKK